MRFSFGLALATLLSAATTTSAAPLDSNLTISEEMHNGTLTSHKLSERSLSDDLWLDYTGPKYLPWKYNWSIETREGYRYKSWVPLNEHGWYRRPEQFPGNLTGQYVMHHSPIYVMNHPEQTRYLTGQQIQYLLHEDEKQVCDYMNVKNSIDPACWNVYNCIQEFRNAVWRPWPQTWGVDEYLYWFSCMKNENNKWCTGSPNGERWNSTNMEQSYPEAPPTECEGVCAP